MYQKTSQFRSSFLLWIQDRPYPIWPKLTTIWRMKIYVPHGFVVTTYAAPYSLNAHRYRITRTLHLRTWIVNYGRSCPRMTYITNGLQERASASSWRCLLGSFMLAREGKYRARGKKGFDSHHILCTPKFPRSCGCTMKTVRKRKKRIVENKNTRLTKIE